MQRLVVACALVLGVALALVLLRSSSAERGGAARVSSVESVAAERDGDDGSLVALEAGIEERVVSDAAGTAEGPVDEPAPGAPAAAAGEPEIVALRGRVLDVAGAPLAGVGIGVLGEEGARARSDGAGRFTLERPRDFGSCTLVVEDAQLATVRRAVVRSDALEREHVIVAASAVAVAGQVRSSAGLPLAGAEVSADPGRVLREFPGALDSTTGVVLRTRTDADGRFALGRVPALAGGELSAWRDGYARGSAPIPSVSRSDVVLELEPSAEEGSFLQGRVLLPDGAPAPEAVVRLEGEESRADEDGAFLLRLPEDVRPDAALAAALEGHGPALVPRFGEIVLAARPEPPAPVTLVLAPDLSITGRVIGADGRPLAGWAVELADPTEISVGRVPPLVAERPRSGASAATGAYGRFELAGLAARDYRLSAFDGVSLLRVVTGPIAAGTDDVVLEIGGDLLHARVAGRVVSALGGPVAGAEVAVALVTAQSGGAKSWTTGGKVVTDESGAFELVRVPKEHVHLRVQGEGVVPTDWELPDGMPVENLVIEVERRCHFKVAVEGARGRGLRIEVRDADGRPVMIHSFQAQGSMSSPTRSVVDGRVEVSAVSERARTVRLVEGHGDAERRVGEEPLVLVPGEVVEVRFDLR